MRKTAMMRRGTAALALALTLAACTTDDLSPPERFTDSPSIGPVGSIAPGPVPEGHVSPYPASAPVASLHGSGGRVGRQRAAGPAVDIDGMLGEEPRVTGLAEEQARQIHPDAAPPVVDGVGTGALREVASVAPPAMTQSVLADPDLPAMTPERQAQEERRRRTFLADQQEQMIKRRKVEEEQQVAFLPRAGSPMSVPSAPRSPQAMPADEVACRSRLRRLGVEFRDVPRIANGPSCGIDYPIELSGLSGGIGVKPAVKLNCEVTEAFALWVKNELAPAARYRYLTGIRTIKPLGGYSCRTMNSRRGNPMSEHARGNAIDVGTFVLKSGREIDVRKPGFFAFREKGLLKAVRSDSCKYFNTVLGPGSDPSHKDHFHFDLRNRKSGYRHCD